MIAYSLKKIGLLLFLFVGVILICSPAQALTFETMTLNALDNGDADLTINYNMGIFEIIGFYLHIANPAEEIKKQFDIYYGPGTVIKHVDTERMDFFIPDVSTVTSGRDYITITTPGFSFSTAEKVLKEHPVAMLASFDLSPLTTIVQFSDGYSERFSNQIDIPSVTHTVNK